MERLELVEKLTKTFRTTFDNDAIIITDELTANDVDNWDSLTHMVLIAEVEKDFGIKFKLKDLIKMKNVGALIEIIISKIN